MTTDRPVAKTTVQSVSRAVKLLLAVATQPDGLTAKAGSELLGVSLSTTYHLLATLAAEGLILKESSRRYVLGMRASVIAAAVSRDTHASEAYLQILRGLAADTGETGYLSAWRNDAVCILASVEGAHAVRVAGLTLSYNDDLHARASGKLLLAYANPADRERLLSRSALRQLTPTTIIERDALEAEFARIRKEELAFDRGEYQEGVECVSAPIIEDGTMVAAFTVSTPSERWATEAEKIIDLVKSAAKAASGLRVVS